jgi:hypothetical protein
VTASSVHNNYQIKGSVAAEAPPREAQDLRGSSAFPLATRVFLACLGHCTLVAQRRLSWNCDTRTRGARNSVGESVQDLLVFLDRDGVLNKKGRLFTLAIGVNKYTKLDPREALHFASADASLIVQTLASKAEPLHTEVKIKLLARGGEEAWSDMLLY